ncbi:hypothetical protein [Deinococcus alpinitundrae]|uniref:hypothetical protein n=1 Tax=Deinococcus alpinitundrae TaxID=468913 RepID=UPI00137AC0DE|nr:hypothetical protein [Deinococcus alpinitundrae]
MPRAQAGEGLTGAVIFITAQMPGGVVLDTQGLRHAPISRDDLLVIEANLRLFEASRSSRTRWPPSTCVRLPRTDWANRLPSCWQTSSPAEWHGLSST